MPNIGTLTVQLIAQATAFEKTMRQAQKTMETTAKSFERTARRMEVTGRSLLLGITVPLGLLGGAAIKMAGDMEQTQIAFTNMLGSAKAAQDFLDQLAKFAEKTPFEYTDLTQQARQLMAYGFAAQDIIPMLTAVGDAVAAMGGNAEMLDRVTRAFGQMQAKQKVTAEEMRQLTEAGIPAWEYLSQAIGKSVPEVMKLSEKGLIPANVAINGMLQAMEKDFGGMMAEQSKTMLGSLSNLRDVFGRLMRTLGEAINQTFGLTQKIQSLTSWVRQAADAFQKMNPALRSAVIWLGLAAFITGPLLYGVGKMYEMYAVASRSAALLSAWAGRAAFAFASWRGGAASLGEALAFTVGGRIKLILLAIGALVAVTILLIRHWDQLAAYATAVWNAVGAAAMYGASLVVRGVGLILAAIGAIVPAVRGAAQSVLGLADSLKGAASQSLASARSAVNMAKTVDQAAQNQSTMAQVGQKASDAQDQLREGMENAAKAAQSNIQSFDEVHQIQEEMAGAPAATMPEPSIPALPGLGGLGADIVAGFGEQIGKIADTAAAAWDRLKQAMEPVNRAVQWIKDNWPTIGPIIEGIAGLIMVLLVPALIKSGVEAMIAAGKHVAAWAMKSGAAVVHGATIIGQLVLVAAKWAWAGIEALAHAGKMVLAWAMQGWEAVKSVAIQLAQFVILGAKWAWIGIQAVINAGKVVLAWVMQQAPAIAAAATTVATAAVIVGKWILMAVTAMANAAVMAAAWFIALGPVAWVIAAIAAVAIAVALNWDTVKAKTIEIWTAVSKWLSDKWEWLKRTVGEVWNKIVGTVTEAWEGLKKRTSEIWDGILGGIKSVINSIIKAFNWMIRGLNKLSFDVPSWVPFFGGKTWGFDLPEIPLLTLAEGGLVTRPSLAMIGERGPEAVVPLERSGLVEAIAEAVERGSYAGTYQGVRIASASGQGQTQQEIVLRIDGTTFARLILPAIIREGQRQGLQLVVRPQGV